MAALETSGGSSGNRRLRQALGWDEDFYWRVQGKLVEEGLIIPGRGMGGSVRLTRAETNEEQPSEDALPPEEGSLVEENAEDALVAKPRERDLYAPLRDAIETKWINKFGFDAVKVEETHSRGSKDTGGTFTRPDITVAGVRRYVYLPKRLEIVTFEVKSADSVGVLGVLEAIAHREAAHRAFVIYGTSRSSFEASAEAERILDLAQKYSVGVMLTAHPDKVEEWEILLDAIRHEPDPARLDRFLGDLPNDEMKKQLSKWKE